ncbi:glycosyltransferase 87 family protein [Chloroflexota bacterium]
MKSRTSSITLVWLTVFLITLVIIVVLGWANLQYVYNLPQKSSFLANWEITRGLIFRGENPYNNPDGRPFSSPLPVVLIYSPFALIENFQIARTVWITVGQIASVIFAFLCIRLTSWQVNRWLVGLILFFALFWFPAVSVYIRGSETSMIAVLFAAAIFAIQKENDEIAGILLGLAALQPRVTLLGVLIVLLWAGSHRRWALHFWTGVVFIFSSGIGMIFLPRWPLDFFWSALRNIDFSFGKTIIETTTRWWPGVGLQIGWGIFILASITLIFEWWLAWGKSQERLIWVLALTFILTIWIGVETNIDHVFMLMLSLIVIFMAWNRRWGWSGQIFTVLIPTLLLPGLWWSFIIFARQGISGSMNPVLMIAFPFLLLISLYWVRWWFLRPTYLDKEETF